MDWVNIISVLVFPVVGWLYGRFSRLESTDAKLSTAIDGLNKTVAAIWDEIKTFRAYDKRIYLLEQKANNYGRNHTKN